MCHASRPRTDGRDSPMSVPALIARLKPSRYVRAFSLEAARHQHISSGTGRKQRRTRGGASRQRARGWAARRSLAVVLRQITDEGGSLLAGHLRPEVDHRVYDLAPAIGGRPHVQRRVEGMARDAPRGDELFTRAVRHRRRARARRLRRRAQGNEQQKRAAHAGGSHSDRHLCRHSFHVPRGQDGRVPADQNRPCRRTRLSASRPRRERGLEWMPAGRPNSNSGGRTSDR